MNKAKRKFFNGCFLLINGCGGLIENTADQDAIETDQDTLAEYRCAVDADCKSMCCQTSSDGMGRYCAAKCTPQDPTTYDTGGMNAGGAGGSITTGGAAHTICYWIAANGSMHVVLCI